MWLNGRSGDTIRSGSETVHASEVERCLQLHPEVAAAAVVGLPHERLGQQVLCGNDRMRIWFFDYKTYIHTACDGQGLQMLQLQV